MSASAKPARRANLRFNSVDDALAEARRIAALESDVAIQYAGNWTAGQMLNHCAAWAEYVYAPNPLKAPWIVRLIMRPFKARMLNKGLRAGRNIPGVKGGTTNIEVIPAPVALNRFIKAYTRLKTDPPTHASPVFGTLTLDEAVKLNLRHAELHLSFVAN